MKLKNHISKSIMLISFFLFCFQNFIAQGVIEYSLGTTGQVEDLFLKTDKKNNQKKIAFRNDIFSGPGLWLNNQIISSKFDSTDQKIYGANDSVAFSIAYKTKENRFIIELECQNKLSKSLENVQLSLRLGLDTEMVNYPNWRSVFFPTLMRCEKKHFWGYFMNPEGRIITISSPDAIASYHFHYNNSKNKISFGNGHRIRTVSLDLLNPAPLPNRHPQGLILKAKEKRTWRIYLEEVDSLKDVAQAISINANSPVFQAEYYTLAPGQESTFKVYSQTTPKVNLKSEDGKSQKIKIKAVNPGIYEYSYQLPKEGKYVLTALSKNGQLTETILTCRNNDYSNYIKAARIASLRYQQKTNSNAESWYGLFSAMIAREHFPEADIDAQVEAVFDHINKMTFDLDTRLPLNNPWRIQDTALKAALWAQYYKASGNIDHLRWAADCADFIMTKQIPEVADFVYKGMPADGAYRAGKTHYTSVIYIAKAIMEVMAEERKLMDKSDEWAYRYKRHYASVKKAMDDLARNLDNIETEGEMTFEDGMISCSYTQLSEFALLHEQGSELRKYYTEAAEKLANMHRCLSQIIVPDSRSNGGSLRFWEAQYDILTMPNMINSPHGWSAWRIYGLKNLYLLTGNYDYLKQMINSIGSCIQLINPNTSDLNWAFVCDPYIVAQCFVPDEANKGKGKHVEQILGEQYMPMISDWYRCDTSKFVSSFWGFDGGSCDNDVHEIFKCLGEVLLTTGYIYQKESGEIVSHNCKAVQKENTLYVIPNESCIDKIHFNLCSSSTVNIMFKQGEKSTSIMNGFIYR